MDILPVEMIVHIEEFLSSKDTISLKHVSSYFYYHLEYPCLRIRTPWKNIEGEEIRASVIILYGYDDDYLSLEKKPTFFCRELFVMYCDKNFVYYNIRHKLFPCTKQVYLDSSPCEPEFFYRFPSTYLSPRFSRYKDKWAKDKECVKIINKSTYWHY